MYQHKRIKPQREVDLRPCGPPVTQRVLATVIPNNRYLAPSLTKVTLKLVK